MVVDVRYVWEGKGVGVVGMHRFAMSQVWPPKNQRKTNENQWN